MPLRSTRCWKLIVVLLTIFSIGCTEDVSPDRSKLAPWTRELRDKQPPDAFVAVYKLPKRRLIWIAAKHSTDTDSLTFRIIENAFSVFDIETVITEGIDYSLGPNPSRLNRIMEWVEKQQEEDGFQPGGETVPTIVGARRVGAVVWGGEPSDTDILATAVSEGFDEQDLLGFYTLRSIPQWIRQKKIRDARDARVAELIESELSRNRSRLNIDPKVLSNYSVWEDWYMSANKKRFGDDFNNEETGPLVDSQYGSNKIAAAVSRARDGYLVQRVADHLNRGETVMVVFGASHLMLVRPVLDSMLGKPCYIGSDLAVADDKCSV